MMRFLPATVLATGVLMVTSAFAQAPAAAPAGSTGLCKDGSYTSTATKKGACRGHQGVKDWYVAAGAAAAAATPAPAPAAPATPAAKPVVAPATPSAPVSAAAPATATTKKSGAYTPPADAAPGGGPGLVWVNDSSKVYHCSTDKWYGRTKKGSYMSEADAKAKGYKADAGKACGS